MNEGFQKNNTVALSGYKMSDMVMNTNFYSIDGVHIINIVLSFPNRCHCSLKFPSHLLFVILYLMM